MATRHCRPIERTPLQLPVSVPVAGFLLALAAVLLQAGWWFAHGWTWSNLARFLVTGQLVAWCVVLILVGASLSWLGLRRTEHVPEGRGWAVAGLATSGLAAVPIMPEVLLLTVLLLMVGSIAGRRPPDPGHPRDGPSDSAVREP